MIVAIASENKPKVSACKKVFNDLMTGAKNRTEILHNTLKNENRPADYYIGLEGGFFIKYNSDRLSPIVFLESWVYVFNGEYGNWGSSGAIEVPEKISEDIINSGKELGEIIDQKMNQIGIRANQGTIGILTNNKITRQDFFESALLFALTPFYNSQIYN